MGGKQRSSAPPPSAPFAGDLLLDFGPEGATPRGRTESSAWETLAQDPEWRLLAQRPGAGWRGFPLTSFVSEDWRAWLLGELYGASREAMPYPEGLSRERESAARLNGHFLLLAWNARTRRWHVWTDRFGTIHAYFASGPGHPAIGTFSPGVARAAACGTLDWLGLAGFFSFGFFARDRTFFEGVRILRPATHAVFDERGTPETAERYWLWRHEPDGARDYDGTVEEFAGLLARVMEEQTREGRVAIPISGGLDSRSTVAALPRERLAEGRLWSYSYGWARDSVETRIAARIATARGLPFEAFTIGAYLPEQLDRVLSCVEGFQDATQSRQAGVTEELRKHAEFVIAAHLGDLWLGDMGLSDRREAGEEEVLSHALSKISKRGNSWLLEKLCSPKLGADPAALLREEVRPEMERLRHIQDPDFRVKAFKTEQWSFRWTIASLRMFQPGAFPRLPFYDTRLSDFFATVPSAFVAKRRLQVDYLKRFAPDLARVPWQKFGANLYRARYFHSWLLPERALRRAWKTIRGAKTIQRNWEVQLLSAEGKRMLHERLLRPGLRVHDLVAPPEIRALLDEFFADPSDPARGYTVSMLLTFAAWLELYG